MIAVREVVAHGVLPVRRGHIDGNGGRRDADVESQQPTRAGWIDGSGVDALPHQPGERGELFLGDARVEVDVALSEQRQRRQRDQRSCEMKSLLRRNPDAVNATRSFLRSSQPS